jgi:hypothetical protein
LQLAALDYNKGVDCRDYNKLKYNTTIYYPLCAGYLLYPIYCTLYLKSRQILQGTRLLYNIEKISHKVGLYAIVRQSNCPIIKPNKQLGHFPNLSLQVS